MSHWAEINENNEVVRILVCDNNDPNGDEGYQWLIDSFGGEWVKVSYNTRNNYHSEGGEPIGGDYPSPGWTYDYSNKRFIPPKPFNSWSWNEEIWSWVAPKPHPFLQPVEWDEEQQEWISQVTIPEEYRTEGHTL